MFRCAAALIISSWCLVVALISYFVGSSEYIGWIGIAVLSLLLALYEYKQLDKRDHEQTG